MPEKVCNNCRWFVEEADTVGDYRHEEAVRLGKGFCLIQDLFTQVEPSFPACSEYTEDGVKIQL